MGTSTGGSSFGRAGLELGYPNELQPVIQRDLRPSDWNETWDITLEEINTNIVQGTPEVPATLPNLSSRS
ncbi:MULTISPECIES: hypothetical protein [Kitasatospora]|uniref:Uncharacterized protein n=1 Tax=Kitasatospora cystarginea TaxID=58350 RepID=A0ABN3F329_9ACTN